MHLDDDVAYARFPRLGERRKQLAGTLSGGEQQMLALSRALATDPAVLLLDELSMGLAPLIVEQLYDAVGQVAAEGVSIRVDQFKAEVADLRLRSKGASQRERVLLAISVVMMIAGIVLAIGAYSAAQNVKVTPGSNLDVLNSNAYLPLSITGLTISVVGGFLFLRYSLAQFLRFWLLRQSYEQRVAIDDVAKRSANP